jgi:hypothetical protein
LGAQDRKECWLKEADVTKRAILKTLVQDGALIKRRNVTGEVVEHLVQIMGYPETPEFSRNVNGVYTPEAYHQVRELLGKLDFEVKLKKAER